MNGYCNIVYLSRSENNFSTNSKSEKQIKKVISEFRKVCRDFGDSGMQRMLRKFEYFVSCKRVG